MRGGSGCVAALAALFSTGAISNMAEGRDCPTSHPYVGKTQDLDLVARQLRGRVTITSDCSFEVSMFDLSDFGKRGEVYWYGARDTDTLTHVQETIIQAGFRLTDSDAAPLPSPSNGTTLEVFLDESLSWDDVGTISAWELESEDEDAVTGRNLGALLTADLISVADAESQGSIAYGENLQGSLAATVLDNCISLSSFVNLRWTVNTEDQSVDFALESIQSSNGWTGFGLAAPGVLSRIMGGSDVVIAGIGEPVDGDEDPTVFAVDTYITTYEECNYGSPADDLTGVCGDYQWSGGDESSDDVELVHAQQYDGITFVRFRRKWDTSNSNEDGNHELDHVIVPSEDQLWIWATGGSVPNSFATEDEENPWFGPRIVYHGPQMGLNHGDLHLKLDDRHYECPLLPGGSSSALSPCSSSFQFADGFDERYSSSATLFGNKVRVFWLLNAESGDVQFGVRSLQSASCVAIGFGKQMVGSDTFVGWNNEAEGSNVYAYRMKSQKASGFEEVLSTAEVKDATIYQTTLPDGGSALSFEFKLDSEQAKERFGLDLANSPTVSFIWSYGKSWRVVPRESDLHTDRSSSATTINLATGSATHELGASAEYISHGVLMWFAWCVVVPIILLSARYVRMLPKSSFLGYLWIKIHKYMAYLVTLLAMIATVIVVAHIEDVGSNHLYSSHSKMGVACMVFLGLQILLGVFRPPPNKKPPPRPEMELTDMSGNGAMIPAGGDNGQALGEAVVHARSMKYMIRVFWEYAHRLVAVVSFALALASVFTGLDEIVLKGDTEEGSERRYAITIAWLCILGAVVVVLELTRMKINSGHDALKESSELLMKQLLGLCVVCLFALFLWDRLEEGVSAETTDGCELQALMFDGDSDPLSDGDATVPEDGTTTTPEVGDEYYTNVDNEVAMQYPNCAAFPLRYVGDGWCDSHSPYNTAECGYDGGDCCDSSVPLFKCEDPDSLMFGEAAETGPVWGNIPRNPRYDVGDRAHSTEEVVTSYNNFYEFGYSKNIKDAAQAQSSFFEDPDWEIEISGLVENPMTIKVVDLINMMHLEERLYRHRCVEAWSIVQPVTGFPVTKLLDLVKPLETAKYMKLQTFEDKSVSFVQRDDPRWPWPYTEAITMDEARNELAFLTVGVFGKALPPQNGAPIRLQLPWKYGFKSVKSITKIEFQVTRPLTFWAEVNGREYGFWANVNPAVSHPRWSQARERELIDSSFSYNYRETVIYNGYESYVGYLYSRAELADEALYMR